MEEENLCSSLSDLTEPDPDSWTSIEHQFTNGEQQGIVWDETGVDINQEDRTHKLSVSPKAGRHTPEEAEQWEQIIWPVRPVTCTSPRLSFATVQWDMPDPSAETPSHVTHSSFANELDCFSVTSVGSTSPSPHPSEDINDELFTQEDRGGADEFDSQHLNENESEPCDAADEQEQTTQEDKDSPRELLGSNDETPLRTDSDQEEEREEEEEETEEEIKQEEQEEEEEETEEEIKQEEEQEEEEEKTEEEEEQEEEEEEDEERGHSTSSDPVEPVDLIESLEEIEASEDESDSFVDLKLEEEQEEPGVLLTRQGDSEEQQTSVNGVEAEDVNEEGGEAGEEESVTIASCHEESEEAEAECRLSDAEDPAELGQTDDTESTINPDKLLDLEQSEPVEEKRHSGTEKDIEIVELLQESPTGQTEELEMCEDVDQKVEPEQSEAADNIEEASEQAADNAERVEDSQEVPELTEELQERSHLQHQDWDQKISQAVETSPQPEHAESEQLEMTEPEEIQQEGEQSEEQLGQHLEPSQMEMTEESHQTENADLPEEPTQTEQAVRVEAEDPGAAEQQEQTEPSEQKEEQTADEQLEQLAQPENTDVSEITERLSPETEVTQEAAEAEFSQDTQAETSHQAGEKEGGEDDTVQTVVANGVQAKPSEKAASHMNGGEVDREKARHLAERLFKLDGIQRVEVVKHLDKDNDFSRAVGEEYLKLFEFTGQTLDNALRSFLKVVVLIGETQERERVLQHFACRFHQCNPESFSSSGAVLALTCALMLLNTDLHGQNVGKSMSSSKFVSNLDGMNEGENFSKDLLKSLYNSIKNEALEWAVDEEELKSSVLVDEDAGDEAPLRSKANPFQDVPHNKTATVVKQGFVQRKLHADIDGKRTPWGKRGWKTFYGVLRGMVIYLQKDDYRRDQMTNEEVVSVHHSLAEPAADYTKKPHVFRLQTADWRVFLFQAASKVEMNSWISRINLVSALHSSPPFPAAVGSQRRFCRPILPASQSADTLESQLQSHAKMLESFKADLTYLQQNLPEGKKAKAKELEEYRVRAEYLQHEMCRYEIYIQVLKAWQSAKKTDDNILAIAELTAFDKAMCADSAGEEEEGDGTLKKSYSSPSLELETPPPTVIKVRRNISERRTYRRTIIPRWNKEA